MTKWILKIVLGEESHERELHQLWMFKNEWRVDIPQFYEEIKYIINNDKIKRY